MVDDSHLWLYLIVVIFFATLSGFMLRLNGSINITFLIIFGMSFYLGYATIIAHQIKKDEEIKNLKKRLEEKENIQTKKDLENFDKIINKKLSDKKNTSIKKETESPKN